MTYPDTFYLSCVILQIVGYSQWRCVARGKQANELARVPPVEPSKIIISCTKFGWEWPGPAIGKFDPAPYELRNGINVRMSIVFVLRAISLTIFFFQLNFAEDAAIWTVQANFSKESYGTPLLWWSGKGPSLKTLALWWNSNYLEQESYFPIWNRNLIWCLIWNSYVLKITCFPQAFFMS